MRKPMRFLPPNRLTKVIEDPKAPTLTALARQADDRIAAHAGVLGVHVTVLARQLAEEAEKPGALTTDRRGVISRMAMQICETAGWAGLHLLGEVARGVYAITHPGAPDAPEGADALRLHAKALKLLDSPQAPGPEAAAEVLKGLHRVRRWLGANE